MAKHQYNLIAATTEMPVWTDDGEAPSPIWGVYTDLGPFKPNRLPPSGTPYAHRNVYNGSHKPHLTARSAGKWLASKWRDAADFMFGAFQPIRDAV